LSAGNVFDDYQNEENIFTEIVKAPIKAHTKQPVNVYSVTHLYQCK